MGGNEYFLRISEKNLSRLVRTLILDALEERFYGENFIYANETLKIESEKLGYPVSQDFPSDSDIIRREVPIREGVQGFNLVDRIYRDEEKFRRRIKRWENETVKSFFRRNLEKALMREWVGLTLEDIYEWVTTRRLMDEYPNLGRSFTKCEEDCRKAIEYKKRKLKDFRDEKKEEINQIREMFKEIMKIIPEGVGRAPLYGSLARSLKTAFYNLGEMRYWYEAMENAQKAAELAPNIFGNLSKEIEEFDERRIGKLFK